MDDVHISRPFERLGARARLTRIAASKRVEVDIERDSHGQIYSIRAGADVDLCVPDTQVDQRHLLLVCRVLGTADRHKFLCGHDEREWFAAAVPETRGVSNVRTAMDALKPDLVRQEINRRGVGASEYASRRTSAYLRQGEWFFIPQEHIVKPAGAVLRNEPLRRGRGKPHFAEFAFRNGGVLVYFNSSYPQGLSQVQYERLIQRKPKAAKMSWSTGRRDMQVFVKGRIRHPDHATIKLDCWHLVQMNTENQSVAMRHLTFID